jgi:hypothetical protein
MNGSQFVYTVFYDRKDILCLTYYNYILKVEQGQKTKKITQRGNRLLNEIAL